MPFKPRRKLLRPKAKPKATAKTVPKSVKAYVNQQIITNEEPKMSFYNVLQRRIEIYDPTGTPATDLFTYDITQTAFLQQGVNQSQRVGNRVSPTSLILRGSISIINSTITANMFFRVLILRKRVGVDSPAGSYGNLYQLGGTAIGPTGTLLDMMRSINRDYYTLIKQKTVFIGSSDSATSVMPGNSTATAQIFTFNLSKHCPKLQYNDGTTYPQNWGLYAVIVPVNANGVNTTNGQLLAFQTTMESEMVYRDA